MHHPRSYLFLCPMGMAPLVQLLLADLQSSSLVLIAPVDLYGDCTFLDLDSNPTREREREKAFDRYKLKQHVLCKVHNYQYHNCLPDQHASSSQMS